MMDLPVQRLAGMSERDHVVGSERAVFRVYCVCKSR